ncbi:putative sulfate transporter [Ceratocystis lukuohia]|uniref:Sulfate transporter n=1 Tax=Ceratocystis lukuohia TaxID=2019550 RepID=A0ABR4MGX7_9PEZI
MPSPAPARATSFLSSVRHAMQYNLAMLRANPLAELSGSLGDLGTLLPLMLALAAQDSISLPGTLVFSGLFNIATGAVFGVPLPVQPMKAIAAAAISHRGDSVPAAVAAAGMAVGALCFVLAASGLLRRAAATVPVPIVKGIQLGAGLSLVTGPAASLLAPLPWLYPPFDNRLWALGVFVLLLATQRTPRFPSALLAITLGLVLALLSDPSALPSLHPWLPKPSLTPHFSTGALSMAVGQAPLTLLNSIVAVSALSADLMPHQPAPGVVPLAYSVALMNAIGPWFGCMPVCHGSGGLAAQVRFGARSGASVMILGTIKLVLGLFVGSRLQPLLAAFPRAVLGITVLAAGLELARTAASVNRGAADLLEAVGPRRVSRVLGDEERVERWNVMLMTAALGLAFKSDAVGFLAGLACHLSYAVGPRVADWWDARARVSGSGGFVGRQRERMPLLG